MMISMSFFGKQVNRVALVLFISCCFGNLLTVPSRSLKCFQLEWPWKLSNPFFSKPSRKDKVGFFNHSRNYLDLPVDVSRSIFVYFILLICFPLDYCAKLPTK